MSNPNKDAVDFTNLIKDKFAMRKDIAPVETSSSASRDYKVGEKFYYGNLLQRATQDIAQGTGLAGGVNFENADPVITTIQNLSNNLYTNGSKNVLWWDLNTLKKSNTSGTWNGNTWGFVGLTYTFNADKSVTVTGTGTGSPVNFYLWNSSVSGSGMVHGKTYVVSGGGTSNDDKAEFYIDNVKVADLGTSTANYEFTYDSSKTYMIVIASRTIGKTHNVTYYPMICLKSDYDLDPTYVPPAMTNRQLTTDKVGMDLLSEVGAVNMLPNDVTTQVAQGVTYTVNDDGSVTANGTATGTFAAIVFIANAKIPQLKNGETYKTCGCPNGGSSDNYELYVVDATTSTYVASDYGNGATFTYNSSHNYNVGCVVRNGKTVSNLVFKPMISLASLNLSYNDYVPYAKTNKELTEYADSFDNQFSSTNNAFVADPDYITKTGIYAVQGRSTMPTTDRWMVIHLNYAGGWCFQFAICLAGSAPGGLGKMACRRADSNARPITSTWSFMN